MSDRDPSAGAPHTAGALAARFGLSLRGDAGAPVAGVATLADARADQLAFLANPRYRSQLAGTHAGVVVCRAEDADAFERTVLVARDPYTAFAKIAALFEPATVREAGVHPSAWVHPDASVAADAAVGPHCSIGARARIGAGAMLGPGCVVGEDCVVGPGCELVARVTLVVRVRLGARVRIHPGAVLGADGFGLAMDRPEDGEPHWIKVPQLGGVVVGDDCEIGANTTIDRGALDDTVLEHDVRLDNQIQIGHNAHIGAHTAMAG
jgi:UDP-3-O-[3-hydroxymyristoyl] glucosamine N-acyltransferase